MSGSRRCAASSTPPASPLHISPRSPTSRISRSPPRPICATTIRSACSRVPREDVLRLHASSGTTGKPTVVGYTRGDLDLWSDLMARTLACAGARPGDIVHNAYGYGLFTGGLGFHYGAERLGCTVVPDLRRRHRAPGHADDRFRRPRPVRDAVLCAQHRRGREGHGRRRRRAAVAARHFRRRALERADAPRSRAHARHQGGRRLRPLRNPRPRRRRRMRRRAERPARLGGPFPVRGDRSRHARADCRSARPASSSSPRSPRKRCR